MSICVYSRVVRKISLARVSTDVIWFWRCPTEIKSATPLEDNFGNLCRVLLLWENTYSEGRDRQAKAVWAENRSEPWLSLAEYS